MSKFEDTVRKIWQGKEILDPAAAKSYLQAAWDIVAHLRGDGYIKSPQVIVEVLERKWEIRCACKEVVIKDQTMVHYPGDGNTHAYGECVIRQTIKREERA